MSGTNTAVLGIVAALLFAGASKADSVSINFDTYGLGALPGSGGSDTRSPGGPNWWYPSNAATSATIVNLGGSNNALLVYNNGNGNDGVIDNVHSPRLNVLAGETGAGVQPGAGASTFTSSFSFRTVSDHAINNFAFKSESWGEDRTTWLRFSNVNGNLQADYMGATGTSTDSFTDNAGTYSGTLNWGDWYRVDTTINFINGSSNDIVSVNVYDSSNTLVWTATDTTWEQYYRLDSEQAPNNIVTGVDSVQFQMRGASSGMDAGVYIDNFSEASAPLPSVAWAGLAMLAVIGIYKLRRPRLASRG